MNCISCNKEHSEKFCPNCGEKATIKKITFSSIITDTISSIINMDKGFLYNIKNLTLEPKKFISEYINGKRKGIQNPFSFLILLTSILIFLETTLNISGTYIPNTPKTDLDIKFHSLGYSVGKFIKIYFKYFWLLTIFPLGISNKLIFGKYNYAEHITISSFIIGLATFFGLISNIIFEIPMVFNPITYIVVLWLIYKTFKNNNYKLENLLLTFSSFMIFIIQLFIIIVLISVIS